MPSSIITIKDVSVTYGSGTTEVIALSKVSLEIYPEEYIIFYGPSGCGKSTLLYSIAGLQKITEGEISVLGKDLKTISQKEFVEFHRRSIGMVFQAYYLISSLSVRANVVLPQIFLGKAKADRIKQGEALLERFGIYSQKGKTPSQLSGGQQQRVAIARSLVNDPSILLADEPVGNLDSKSSEDVLKLLQELNERDKKTVILVTHNPDHLKYASRIFYMQDGKIVREVKNTDRKQVREEVAKPMKEEWFNEFAKLYPNLSNESLKAKMVASYLLEEIDQDTQARVENSIQSYFIGNIDERVLANTMAQPLDEGGIGFYRSTADRFSDELHSITIMSRYLKNKFGVFPKRYEDLKEILEKLSKYLLLSTDTRLADQDLERFFDILQARIEGSINKERFEELLDKPIALGGVGLNIRTAHKISRHLELLLIDYASKKNTEAAPLSPNSNQNIAQSLPI